jgi:hypothetical protein
MTRVLSRSHLLPTAGAAGLGLLLAACGGSGPGGSGDDWGDAQILSVTYTVTTLFDSGPGSLRNVVEDVAPNAPGGHEVIIVFAPGLAGGTISLISPLVLPVDMHIDGAGPGGTPGERIQISGLDAVRLFEIAEGLEVTLRNLVLRDGWTNGYGGAIHNAGRLFLRNTLVQSCFAGLGGGGIRLEGENSGLSIRRCAFTDCEADWGGALMGNDGWLIVEQTSFAFNHASESGGGALWFVEISPHVSNCTFHGNTNSDATSSGAAIHFGANAASGAHELTLLHCTITGNSSASATGAAVDIDRGAGYTLDVIIRGTIIAENTGPADCDLSLNAAAGAGSDTITHSLIGVGNADTLGLDGVDDNSVGTQMVPLDPMLTVLTPLFGPGDGRLHRFALAGSPALDLVPLGLLHAFGGPVLDEDQRDRPRGLDGFTDAGATDVESP